MRAPRSVIIWRRYGSAPKCAHKAQAFPTNALATRELRALHGPPQESVKGRWHGAVEQLFVHPRAKNRQPRWCEPALSFTVVSYPGMASRLPDWRTMSAIKVAGGALAAALVAITAYAAPSSASSQAEPTSAPPGEVRIQTINGSGCPAGSASVRMNSGNTSR